MEHSKGFGQSKVTTHSFNSDDVDLFDPVIIEKSVISGRTIGFRPISENNNGPFQFNLEPQGHDQYLQLNSIKLGGKIQIMDKNEAFTTEDFSIVNLFAQSLFRAQEIEINNVLVSDLSSFLSHYQAYIQTILSYNESAQKTHLKAQLFEMDTPARFDVVERVTKKNTAGESILDVSKCNRGYVERQKICGASQKFDFFIPICSDILQCDRLLHSSASLKIKLLRECDEFSVLSKLDKSFKIKITDLKIYGHYVKIADNIVQQHLNKMKKTPLIYPITRTLMKEYTIAKEEKTKYISNLFTGQLPKSIVIGLVDDDAASGDYSLNPFNFKHFDINEAYIKKNGEMVPGDPWSPDFTNNIYKREYMELMRNIGIESSEDHGNAVTLEQFAGGSFFMAFDLTGHKCNMLHNHPSQKGNIDLMVQFKKPLPSNVRIIIYASTDAQVEIDSSQDVTVRYI